MGRGIENSWNKIPRKLEEKELDAGEMQKDIFPWKRKVGGMGEEGKKRTKTEVFGVKRNCHTTVFLRRLIIYFILFYFIFKPQTLY